MCLATIIGIKLTLSKKCEYAMMSLSVSSWFNWLDTTETSKSILPIILQKKIACYIKLKFKKYYQFINAGQILKNSLELDILFVGFVFFLLTKTESWYVV